MHAVGTTCIHAYMYGVQHLGETEPYTNTGGLCNQHRPKPPWLSKPQSIDDLKV